MYSIIFPGIIHVTAIQVNVTETILFLFRFRYAKRLIAWWKRKEETEEDVFTRWEKDFELPPLSRNGLFEEYLELGKAYIEKLVLNLILYVITDSDWQNYLHIF